MRSTGRNNPKLRPILNKHRKSPSLSNLLAKDTLIIDKPCSKSLNSSKSENFLPKIFQVPLNSKKCITKTSLPPFIKSERAFVGTRNVSTPFFKPQSLDTQEKANIPGSEWKIRIKNDQKNEIKQDRAFRKRKNNGSRFFDHIKMKNLAEISFGEKTDMMPNAFAKNKTMRINFN
ncbi:hypothetical protein SteCoe_17667 [Stentor coeruleus]|uniref:Uncharacterized protein n=1 Tax=Stentor coeruleus TaxID=5963 RepID=A0A1R2BYD8_9CILI|nr:hypothetical protein SteCoe_17667 [Stentor coeruleus]